MSSPVITGSFRLWLKNTVAPFNWVAITPTSTPIAASGASYNVPWFVTQAAGTYKLWVYYYDALGNVSRRPPQRHPHPQLGAKEKRRRETTRVLSRQRGTWREQAQRASASLLEAGARCFVVNQRRVKPMREWVAGS